MQPRVGGSDADNSIAARCAEIGRRSRCVPMCKGPRTEFPRDVNMSSCSLLLLLGPPPDAEAEAYEGRDLRAVVPE